MTKKFQIDFHNKYGVETIHRNIPTLDQAYNLRDMSRFAYRDGVLIVRGQTK